MIAVCNRCGHLCTPSVVDGYTYECRECDEDFYTFEVREFDDAKCEECYIDYFNNYLTVGAYADHNYMDDGAAKAILNRGKEINHNR